MNRYIFTIITIFVAQWTFPAFSQQENWRISYDYTYVFDSLKQEVRDDIFLLEITPTQSCFFSRYTAENAALRSTPEGKKQATEIMAAAMKDMKATGRMQSNFPHKRGTVVVISASGTDSLLVFDDIQNEVFKWKSELPEWELGDSVQEVNGILLQEAMCEFHGRHWHAWFSADYPFQEGPWCLKGLPGLIFNVYDEKREHVFELSKIEPIDAFELFYKENGKLFPNVSRGSKWIDRKKFNRDRRKYLENSGFELFVLQKEMGENTTLSNKVVLRRDFLETDYRE